MRDPRLAELEFLSELERNGDVHVTTEGIANREGGTFGIGKRRWHDLIFHLLVEGFVRGPSLLAVLTRHAQPGEEHGRARMDALFNLEQGLMVQIALTHKGRLRLWELRQELEGARRLEPLGVLFGRESCEADYDIAWAFPSGSGHVALMAMDLDNFKAVNDAFDHSKGDEVLKRYFTTIKASIGRNGTGYRYGGDEVLVIISPSTLDELQTTAERVRRNIELEFNEMTGLDKLKVRPTASIGALLLSTKVPYVQAYQAVDALERKSKKDGKNRATVEAMPLA